MAKRRAPARTRERGTGQRAVRANGRAATLDGAVAQGRAEAADAAEPQALVASHWFDAGDGDRPYSATVRLTGRRVGAARVPSPRDTFTKEEIVEGIVPGTGPVTVSSVIYGVEAGEWMVSAEVVRDSTNGSGAWARKARAVEIRPAAWSWRRWAVIDAPVRPLRTRWALLAPLVPRPGVVPGVYTALAVLGILLALALQATILGSRGPFAGAAFAASVIGLVAGLAAAKIWYAVLHPKESVIRGGWAVDGFLVVAPLAAAVMLFAFDVPIGLALDAVTPGIFFAVALGRLGCLVTGCCAGLCSASRWALWSSDTRVGARRIPTQLMESAAGLVIGVVSLAVVLGGAVPLPGAVFVIALGLYAAVRQVLLRLRAERRKSAQTVPLTAVASAAMLAIVVALAVVQGA